MRWPDTLLAKIVRRLHQPLAKVVVPDPVHDDARQQLARSVLGIRQPLAKRTQPALRLAKPVVVTPPRKHPQKTGRHRLAGRLPTAVAQHARLRDPKRNLFRRRFWRLLDLIKKRRRKLVILLRTHRVHRMVVASCAAKRNSKKRRTGGRHHIIQSMKLFVIWICVILQLRAQVDELPKRLEHVRRVALIKVHSHKPVERHIVIQSTDDSIAKFPGVPTNAILINRQRPLALSKTNDIKPMPAPAFAKSGILQQAIDQSLESLWLAIGDEGPHLFGRGRQTGQAKRNSANQRVPIRLQLRLKFVITKLGQYKPIHRIPRPIVIANHRNSRRINPLHTPQFFCRCGPRKQSRNNADSQCGESVHFQQPIHQQAGQASPISAKSQHDHYESNAASLPITRGNRTLPKGVPNARTHQSRCFRIVFHRVLYQLLTGRYAHHS